MSPESLTLIVFVVPLVLFIALVAGFLRVFRNTGNPSTQEPISLVIPFRNEKNNLPALNQRLQVTEFHNNDEIFWVNDGSNDGFSRPSFSRIQLIEASPSSIGSKKKALERGILASTNDWILTTDADTTASPDWPALMRKNIAEHKSMVIGPVLMTNSGTFAGRLSTCESLCLATITVGTAAWGIPLLCSGANLLFRKSSWNRLGRYDAHMHLPSGDDVLLMHQFWKDQSQSIAVCADRDAVVFTQAPDKLIDWLYQRKRWASKFGHLAHPAKLLITLWIIVWLYSPFLLLLLSWQSLLVFLSLELFWILNLARTYQLRCGFLDWVVFRWLYPLLLPVIAILPYKQWKR